jgi:hypothetical protein
MDISIEIQAALDAYKDSDELKQKIAQRVRHSFDSAVESLFGYNSEINRAILAKVTEACPFDPRAIDLPGYQALIATHAASSYVAAMESIGISRTEEIVRKQLQGFLGDATSIKLSTLIEMVRDEAREDDRHGEISFHHRFVSGNRGDFTISLDPAPGKDWHACSIRLQVCETDKRVYAVTLAEAKNAPSKNGYLHLGHQKDIQIALTECYVRGIPLEMDVDKDTADLEIPEPDED